MDQNAVNQARRSRVRLPCARVEDRLQLATKPAAKRALKLASRIDARGLRGLSHKKGAPPENIRRFAYVVK